MKIMYFSALMLLSGCVTLVETPEEAMQRMARESHDKAAALLTDPSPQNRARAVADLSRREDPETVALLVKALGDPEAVVREAAAEALRDNKGGQAAQADVIAALKKEPDPSAAVAMGWTLQRWGGGFGDGLATLLQVLEQQKDPRSRYHAALLVKDLAGAETVVPVFVDTLGTPVAKNARNKPEDLLADLIPAEPDIILPRLVAASTNSNADTRREVARLLFRFKPRPDALDMVRRRLENPDADVQGTVLPPPAEETLLKLLVDANAGVRASAAWSAGMCEPAPDAAGPVLLAMLEDEAAEARAAACLSLGPLVALKRAPEGSLEAMGKLVDDPDPRAREDAALALAHLGELPESITRALAARVDMRTEPDAEVRAAAANALGRGAAIPEAREALLLGMADPRELVVHRSLAAIGHRGLADPEVVAAVAARITPAFPKGTRLTALGALRDLGTKAGSARAAVLAWQADPDEDIRQGVADALARMTE